MENDNIRSLLNHSYFYLKFRPRTKKEIVDYLRKKIKNNIFLEDDLNKTIIILEEKNFINDKDFTSWFVESRNRAKPKGKFILIQELLRLGIEKELINDYFENQPIDEAALALKTLRKHWARFEKLSKKDKLNKAYQFLLRRGFSFDTIKASIAKIEQE